MPMQYIVLHKVLALAILAVVHQALHKTSLQNKVKF
nr:MAG TPA: hypothetical protein [Caudoviricetes sp.]